MENELAILNNSDSFDFNANISAEKTPVNVGNRAGNQYENEMVAR